MFLQHINFTIIDCDRSIIKNKMESHIMETKEIPIDEYNLLTKKAKWYDEFMDLGDEAE